MAIVELTCMGCPLYCRLTTHLDESTPINLNGYFCKIDFNPVSQEYNSPTTFLKASLPVHHGILPRVNVETQQGIFQSSLSACIDILKTLQVRAPINKGDIISKSLAHTNVSLISTQTIPRRD
ncbi:MAG: DUF1667 domain-containing protein [Clostridium sp.]|uniref:DUF1667 domain-containing protein n=1 Tax=Niameybacter sp. TaxID=2033640 RepID=UPI002FC606B3